VHKVEAVVIRERVETVIDAVEDATGHVGVTVIEAIGRLEGPEPLRAIERHPLRDPSTHRVPEHVRRAEPERVHEPESVRREKPRRVARLRGRRTAGAPVVEGEYGMPFRERRDEFRRPGRARISRAGDEDQGNTTTAKLIGDTMAVHLERRGASSVRPAGKGGRAHLIRGKL